MKDKAEQERRQLNRNLMKKTFVSQKNSIYVASLCKYGILGGTIILEGESMRYLSDKAMLPQKYKYIEIKYGDIFVVRESTLFLIPTVTIQMKNGEEYQFFVFRKKRFLEILNKKRRR